MIDYLYHSISTLTCLPCCHCLAFIPFPPSFASSTLFISGVCIYSQVIRFRF
ncbi:hypothetical protein BJX96DRAFT_45972 [Aspergillus floccosus]